MTGKPLSDSEFRDLLGSFRKTAFYLETQERYALDYEAADLERFLAGNPQPPTEISWWRPWLDQIKSLTQQGKRITRIRVISDPPSDYQRWGLYALPWHRGAGEQVTYIDRDTARRIGLPLDHDWWLLDDVRVIRLNYTPEGRLSSMMLITAPESVAEYKTWRDVAVRNAIPAEEVTAA